MSPGVGLEITDEPDWEDHIANVDQNTGRLKELAAREIVRRTKILAPVDTGNLRNSYRAEEQPDGDWLAGSNVVYAPFQEFDALGTPHLRPALDQVRQDVAGIVGRVRGLLGTTPGGLL